MGVYLNPGKTAFEEAINSEIFVDKTEMILFLNTLVRTKQKYVSVSRPRRFGKTMAADMLCAYYDRKADSRSMFEKLKVAKHTESNEKDKWDKYLGQFDVIRIVMTKFFKTGITAEKALSNMQLAINREIKKAYPDKDFIDDNDLILTLDDAYSEDNKQVVIIIDEWDAVFRAIPNDKAGQTKYLDFLRDLMKDKPYLSLAYMTGILPIKKYGKHSALNMFDEYSMTHPMELAPYTGFTELEIKDLCKTHDMDFKEISNWYNGYIVSGKIPIEFRELYRQREYEKHKFPIYSPLSVVKAVHSGKIMNYWNKTETYEALAEYIRMDYDGLKEAVAILMDGGRVKIDTSTYQNDMVTFYWKDDIMSLLIHLGYLSFDDETSEVFIPNKEILDEFKTSTKSAEWVSTFKSFELSQKLLKATWEADADKVAELLEKAHDKAGNKTYNDEAALSYAVQYAYYAEQKYYTTILELDSGKGYADIVYLPSPTYPDKPALLIELKCNKSAEGAIAQIKRQNYPERLEHYKGNLLLIGINYDKNLPNNNEDFKRHHTCVIEKA